MNNADQRTDGLRIKELFNPQLVSIYVGPARRLFSVPRSIVCDLSELFRKAFSGGFVEGQTGVITLLDTEEWVFETFVVWLYTDRLSEHPWKNAGKATSPADAIPQEEMTEVLRLLVDADDTTTIKWYWSLFFEMYIFADKYDSKLLRCSLMNGMLQESRDCNWPDTEQLIFAFNAIPESSLVHTLLLDILVHETWPEGFEASMSELPVSVAMRLTSELKKSQESVRAATSCIDCLAWRGMSCPEHSSPEYQVQATMAYHESEWA